MLSAPLTGHREPWDAGSLYYPCVLVVVGFIPAWFHASRFWLWALGALLGQALVFVTLSVRTPGPLWPVGLLFLFAYSLLSLLGAALGAWFHRRGQDSSLIPMNFRSFLLSWLALLLTGCVFLDQNPLPKQPVETREATLADFAGDYRLIVEPKRQAGESCEETFGFLQSKERRTGDILRLAASPDMLSVRYESGSQSVETGTIDTTSAQCGLNRGRLILSHPVSSRGPIIPGASFSSGRTTTLFLAGHAELIVITQSWEAAAPLLIFPFYESKRRVYRFQRIK